MWQGEPFAFGSGRQQYRRHGCGLTNAYCGHVRLDEPHGVIYRKRAGNGAARAVDVQGYVAFGIFGFKEQQFGHNDVCHDFIYFGADKNYVIPEQAGIDVVMALSAPGGFDYGWY
jgi:hypothetical protein